MKAISTKILPGTYHLPTRIKAYDGDGNSVIFGTNDEIFGAINSSDERFHKLAAQRLADKMEWKGELIGGWTKEGYVFVFLPPEYRKMTPEEIEDELIIDAELEIARQCHQAKIS